MKDNTSNVFNEVVFPIVRAAKNQGATAILVSEAFCRALKTVYGINAFKSTRSATNAPGVLRNPNECAFNDAELILSLGQALAQAQGKSTLKTTKPRGSTRKASAAKTSVARRKKSHQPNAATRRAIDEPVGGLPRHTTVASALESISPRARRWTKKTS